MTTAEAAAVADMITESQLLSAAPAAVLPIIGDSVGGGEDEVIEREMIVVKVASLLLSVL